MDTVQWISSKPTIQIGGIEIRFDEIGQGNLEGIQHRKQYGGTETDQAVGREPDVKQRLNKNGQQKDYMREAGNRITEKIKFW